MLPKLVCRLDPALVLRQVLVKSMKPTGVMVASPILSCSGEACGASACAAGAGGVKANGAGRGAGSGAGGTTGVVEATCPVTGNFGPTGLALVSSFSSATD